MGKINSYEDIFYNIGVKILEIEEKPNNTRVTHALIGKHIGLTSGTVDRYKYEKIIPTEKIKIFCEKNNIDSKNLYYGKLNKYCKDCDKILNNENTATKRQNRKNMPLDICISCKEKSDKEECVRKRKVYEKTIGEKICKGENCKTIITKNTCYTKKYTSKSGVTTESLTAMCKKCSNKKQTEREKAKRKQKRIEREKNKPKKKIEVKRKPKPKPKRKPKPKPKKAIKQKENTLTKKLERETVETIPKVEIKPIEVDKKQSLGKRQANAVFEEQARRSARTEAQKQQEKWEYI